MIKLYHSPRSRSVRVRWLLEELELPHELATKTYRPPTLPFSQDTPLGKFPTLEDGDVVMIESGAIVEYLLERYGEGRLGPRPGESGRAEFLQWLHFAESTLAPPVMDVLRHTVIKPEAERIAAVVEDGRARSLRTLEVLDRALGDRQYVVGDGFTAADIMIAYPLQWAAQFAMLESFPRLDAYLKRLLSRPAALRAMA
jgi:glutathione S-transferase